jgi:hypothetical protein
MDRRSCLERRPSRASSLAQLEEVGDLSLKGLRQDRSLQIPRGRRRDSAAGNFLNLVEPMSPGSEIGGGSV